MAIFPNLCVRLKVRVLRLDLEETISFSASLIEAASQNDHFLVSQRTKPPFHVAGYRTAKAFRGQGFGFALLSGNLGLTTV